MATRMGAIRAELRRAMHSIQAARNSLVTIDDLEGNLDDKENVLSDSEWDELRHLASIIGEEGMAEAQRRIEAILNRLLNEELEVE